MRQFSIGRRELMLVVKATLKRHRHAPDGDMFYEKLMVVIQNILPSSVHTRRNLKNRSIWRYLAIVCYIRQSYGNFSDFDDRPLGSLEETVTEVFQAIYPLYVIVCDVKRGVVDRKMLDETEDLTCGICLMEVELEQKIWYLPCDHWFHAECIPPWILTNPDCPKCRQAAWGG